MGERGGGVDEVGAGLDTPHGPGGAVVRAGSLLGRVEGAEPPPLLRLRVPYLRRVPSPRAAPHPAVPHSCGGSGGGATADGGVLVGPLGGGLGLLGLGEGLDDRLGGVGGKGGTVEPPECFFHGRACGDESRGEEFQGLCSIM